MARTEEQILTQAGVLVKLGGKEYSIKPLVIRDARAWRMKVAEYISKLDIESDDFDVALKHLLVTMQDVTIDLFFEYAKDLDRKKIEGEATEEDIAEAFSRVVEVAFPLAQSLPMVKRKLSA